MTRIALSVALALAMSCAHPSIDRTRYSNRPVVTAVNDRVDTPRVKKNRVSNKLYHYDGLVHRRLTRAAELRKSGRALGTNALDEVPDSTWFQNRIGVRNLSIEELRRGPNRGDGPMAHKPWTIESSKLSGVAPGFIIRDSAGVRYLLKFDERAFPELETGTHIVVHRILWALGYHVPQDWLVHVHRHELELADDAVVEDVFGNQREMSERDVERVLSRAAVPERGPIRALASQFVPGEPVGGFAREGTREDDPNDLIPHEKRRDLRGLYAIFAWLKHTDVKQDNTLDAWVESPTDPGRHYLVHYQIDFGKALGALTRRSRMISDGYAYFIDFEDALGNLLTLGLIRRDYDSIEAHDIPGVGVLEVDPYDPGEFSARSPYWPLEEADRFDGFWASKLIMRLRPEQLAAIVDEASYRDPRASEYLLQQLVRRQRKTAAYWFSRVSPLDEFEIRGDHSRFSLCFSDLMRKYGLRDAAQLRQSSYRGSVHDYRGQRLEGFAIRSNGAGRVCIPDLPTGQLRDRYTIVKVHVDRRGASRPPVLVHIAAHPVSEELRVVGIRRK